MPLPDGAFSVDAGGARLWLLPERAAYAPATGTLYVADAHLGKAAAFRNAGLAVPRGTTRENLERLSELIERLQAGRVVFLGDLTHSAAARRASVPAFLRWRERHASLRVVLVRGNHDRHGGDPPADWGVACVSEPHLDGGFALCHVPRRVEGSYALAGHVHPGVRLAGPGRDSLRLPCFWLTKTCAVLPAFGAFTGLADVTPQAGDRIYVAAGARVVAAHRGDG